MRWCAMPPDDFATQLIAAARSCLGTRFRWQGRDPATGLDCVGLILWAAHQAGFRATVARDYRWRDRLDLLVDSGLGQAGLMPAHNPEPGDVLVFSTDAARAHIGLFAGPTIIHAHAGVRRVVEHRLDAEWRARLAGAYRFPRRQEG
jgi:murein DD-endopeptidase / murein LD-carboxypeptidase